MTLAILIWGIGLALRELRLLQPVRLGLLIGVLMVTLWLTAGA